MISMTPIIYSLLFTICLSHMSLQFPYTRHVTSTGREYAKWESNEPMIPMRPRICHGLPSERTVDPRNRFTAGQTITLNIYGTVPHSGGHCSFWISTDDITFIKIIDVKDCTLNAQSTQVTLPDTLPRECTTKCTFAWTWIPSVSGKCEIYNNCADISVSGLPNPPRTDPNPQVYNFQNLVANAPNFPLCQRVDVTTHWSRTFMPLKGVPNAPPPNNPPPTSPPQQQPPNTPPSSTSGGTNAPTPAPVVPVVVGNIQFDNNFGGTVNQWHYTSFISNIANGYTIERLQVGSNGKYVNCYNAEYSEHIVYNCNPQPKFVYPLGVRIWATNNEFISAVDVIYDNIHGPQDIGINFGNGYIAPQSSGTNKHGAGLNQKGTVEPEHKVDNSDSETNDCMSVMNCFWIRMGVVVFVSVMIYL